VPEVVIEKKLTDKSIASDKPVLKATKKAPAKK